ncbi:hypothetical protein V8F20_004607 [Naviculisporaceae sp. PSN 640]
MTRPQQPSILSFFQPKSLPQHAAPPPNGAGNNTPPNSTGGTTTTSPPAPPLPPPEASQRLPSPTPPVSITTTTITLPKQIPVLPSPPSLPNQASIVPIEEHHIPALRRINSLLLPVSYPDSFYSKILDPLCSGLFSRVILWKDDPGSQAKVIGGVVCRLEPNQFVDPETGRPRALPPPPPPKSTTAKPNQESATPPLPEIETSSPFYAIYIQSLALLSPYRSQGLAAAALEHIIASAAILPAAGASIDARTFYAHVWTENEEALKWYESRGFRKEGKFPLQGYYFKLRPDTAWIMRRDIGPSAALAATTTVTSSARSTPAGVASPPLPSNSVVAAAVNLPPISSKLPPPAGGGGPPRSGPPPPRGLAATSASSAASSSLSFQNTRPEREWNDLPEDMVVPKTATSTGASVNSSSTNLLAPPAGAGGPPGGGGGGGAGGSEASSRSSSVAGRKKEKKRAYPAAAFGQ